MTDLTLRHLNRLKRRAHGPLLALLAVGFFSYGQPAYADLKVCNDTDAMVGVAVGYQAKNDWMTEGWWQIPKAKCATLIEGDLNARYFYLHAEHSESRGHWRGPVFMCTSSAEFKITGLKNCFARGFEKSGFFEVDTGTQKNWQVRLTNANQSQNGTNSE